MYFYISVCTVQRLHWSLWQPESLNSRVCSSQGGARGDSRTSCVIYEDKRNYTTTVQTLVSPSCLLTLNACGSFDIRDILIHWNLCVLTLDLFSWPMQSRKINVHGRELERIPTPAVHVQRFFCDGWKQSVFFHSFQSLKNSDYLKTKYLQIFYSCFNHQWLSVLYCGLYDHLFTNFTCILCLAHFVMSLYKDGFFL